MRRFIEPTAHKKNQVPSVFIDVKSPSQSQRVTIKLYEHINPLTADNFLHMCKGFQQNGKKVSYENVKFQNKIQDLFIETQEVKDTMFGEGMECENYSLEIDRPGLVGMSRTGAKEEDKNSSGFWVNFAPMKYLKNHVVVGEVVEGLDQLKAMQDENIEIVKSGYLKQVEL